MVVLCVHPTLPCTSPLLADWTRAVTWPTMDQIPCLQVIWNWALETVSGHRFTQNMQNLEFEPASSAMLWRIVWRERKIGQTHQWEKQKAFWFVAPGPSRDLPHLCLQIPCDNAPSLLVTTSSTSAFGPQGDKCYMQPKIFFAWGDRVLNTAAFERLAEGKCPAKHVGKKSSVWETRGRECLLPERI